MKRTRRALNPEQKALIQRERWEVLQLLEHWLEVPMLLLAWLWTVLFMIKLALGLSPFLTALGYGIWLLFVLEFLVSWALAPEKKRFIQSSRLTLLSVMLPVARVARSSRVWRKLIEIPATGGMQLVRFVVSTHRWLRALGRTLARRGFGQVVLLTTVVIFAGAAGIYGFESGVSGPDGIDDYGSAVWWTAMLITTIGSDTFPRTPGGRIVCVGLAAYGLVLFGYITATVVSFFIERDAANPEAELPGSRAIEDLRSEIRLLRLELSSLGLGPGREGPGRTGRLDNLGPKR